MKNARLKDCELVQAYMELRVIGVALTADSIGSDYDLEEQKVIVAFLAKLTDEELGLVVKLAFLLRG